MSTRTRYFPTAFGRLNLSEDELYYLHLSQTNMIASVCQLIDVPRVIFSDITCRTKDDASRWWSSFTSTRTLFISPSTAHVIYHVFTNMDFPSSQLKHIMRVWFGTYLGLFSLYDTIYNVHKLIDVYTYPPEGRKLFTGSTMCERMELCMQNYAGVQPKLIHSHAMDHLRMMYTESDIYTHQMREVD